MALNKFSPAHVFLLAGAVTVVWGIYGLFTGKAYGCVFFYTFRIAEGKAALFWNLGYIVLGAAIAAIAARFLKG